jgi:hypothetical protein
MSTNIITIDGDWTAQYAESDTYEQIRSDVITKLKEIKGDCFFNIEVGIDWDYFASAKLQPSDFDVLQSQILQICYEVDNVYDVVLQAFLYNQDKRSLDIKILINNSINITL